MVLCSFDGRECRSRCIPLLAELRMTYKSVLHTESCQMLAVRWVVVRCVMYLVRLLNHQISIDQWGHSVIWWSKQVHYTSHNNPFDNRHLAHITLPAHFPFVCAASASVTRAPRRMVESIVFPSWQAHS